MEAGHNNIFQEFKKTCQTFSGKTCIKFKKGDGYSSITYKQLFSRVLTLQDTLLKSGIKPGDRVAILLTNGPHWPTAFFAAASIQAVSVPIDIQLNQEAIKEILLHSSTKLILTEERFGIALGEILGNDVPRNIIFIDRCIWSDDDKQFAGDSIFSRFSDNKLAALFYTSGTTKEQKAVMLTHKNLLSNVASIKKVNILKTSDTIMSLLPLHHIYPFTLTCLVPLLSGSIICYLQTAMHNELFAGLKENKVTIFVGVPQLFALIERSISDQLKKFGTIAGWGMNVTAELCHKLSTASGGNLSKKVFSNLHAAFGGHLRLMTSGGAKLDPEVARSFLRWGFNIIEGYGLTETSPVVTFNPVGSVTIGSVGKPLFGVKVKIVNSDEDKIGEIAVKGDNVMLGYYRNQELSKKVLRDGWFFTGDLGFIDKKGYLYITGRSDEIIILPSGKKINPEKIEAHYLKSRYIKDICVFYVKAKDRQGHLFAVVVPDEEYLRRNKHININFKIRWELDGFSQRLPDYQRIKGFVLTQNSLARTRLGKLMRYKIAEEYSSGEIKLQKKPKEKEAGISNFEETALRYLSKMLDREVSLEDHLELDLGLDSLGRIELLSSLQDVVSVGIDDSLALELFEARTIKELITKARRALPETAFSGFLKREEAVFWPQVLSQPLDKSEMKKLKLNFNFIERCIAILELIIIKILFGIFFLANTRGKNNIPKEPPFVVAANHVTYFDPFFVICALPIKLLLKTYFVGFGVIFRHPLVAWGARFHRLVPIDADLNLAQALRVCKYLIKENKILVYFPEGQRSADGKLKEFRKGIGILVKESGADVLPVFLKGVEKVWPRTRALPRPARVTAIIGNKLGLSQLKKGSGKDEYEIIAENLKKEIAKLIK